MLEQDAWEDLDETGMRLCRGVAADARAARITHAIVDEAGDALVLADEAGALMQRFFRERRLDPGSRAAAAAGRGVDRVRDPGADEMG